MNLKWLLLPLLFLSFGNQTPTYNFPQKGYFTSPLPPDVPMILAGSFGELRSNHFHGGMDLKTKGQTGMNLRSVAKGYISRIRISSYGYGKVLYITHPNGFTSVYAHLLRYNERLEKFISKIQVEKEKWDIEVYLGKNEFPVNQGEFVAVSGNSGASRAPHLHFEIRHSKTQTPVDPQLCGFDIADKMAPRIYKFQIHPLNNKSHAKIIYTNGRSGATHVTKPIIARVSGRNNIYRLYPIKEIQASGTIGFSISTNDYHDGSYNKLGVPIIEMYINGEKYFKQDIQAVPLTKTRYLNALVDYEALKRQGRYYYRNHILPGNKLNIYPLVSNNNGAFNPELDSTYDIEFRLKDRNGNESKLKFLVTGAENTIQSTTTISAQSNSSFKQGQVNTFEEENIYLRFPAQSFYTDINFTYIQNKVSSKGYSHIHDLHDRYTPIHKYFLISIKALDLPERYRSKALIKLSGRNIGGFYKDGYVRAMSKYFGSFHIDVDTIPPMASLHNIYNGKNMYRSSSIMVRIGDNSSGVGSVKSFIDGRFIPMEYDYKTGYLTYKFTETDKKPIDQTFKIEVIDKVGNKTVKEVKFKKP